MADISKKSRKSSSNDYKAPAAGDLICITGVSGFLGSHLVREALERGYRVRGTVRSTKDQTKTAHLLALPGAAERLELVEADLNDADPFTKVFKGCKYVLHSASPLGTDAKDPQREIVDPAVRGVLSAMQAALANGVRRVVVTSSTASLSDVRDRVFTEADWNTTSNLKRLPYFYSKTLAERAGWDFVDQHKDDPNCPQMISILPGAISGPAVGPSGLVNPINGVLRQLLDGQFPAAMNLGFCFVDVRDCAAAHLAALEKRKASGRYICCDESILIKDIIAFLRAKFPGSKTPTKDWSGPWMTSILKFFMGFSGNYQNQFIHYALGGVMRVDNSKIKNELGIAFRDPRDGWVEVVNQMIEEGSIKSLPSPIRA